MLSGVFMKKTALFLAILLFFGVLAAEDAQKESETPASDETPDFFVQPAVGFGTGLSLFRPTLALDIDFLAAHLEKCDFYAGLDLDFRYIALQKVIGPGPKMEVPVQANVEFDFPVAGKEFLKSAGLWISAGLDLIIYNEAYKYYPDKKDDKKWEYRYKSDNSLRLFAAWGIGVSLLFKKDLVLKLGIDGFGGIYPDRTVLVGYRF